MRKSTLFLSAMFIVSSLHSQVNIVTQHVNNNRTGWNNRETLLNTKNVKPGAFGKLFTLPLDDQMYAEPLLVRVNLTGFGMRNVLYAATVNNTIYAYDADSVRTTGAYWSKN